MLGLSLRKEFQGRRLKGTAIDLKDAVQGPAKDLLDLTYPSSDLLKALAAIQPEQARPVVLLGNRGLGKSHLMAALHHALTDETATRSWLQYWGDRLGRPDITGIALRTNLKVVSESLHHGRYKFLWDILFKHHPRGALFEGRWTEKSGKKTSVPSKDLLLEMLQEQPMALLLDEYQTWFDGLVEEPARPQRTWAFNFIQLLSEIAVDHPDLLLLVVTVRDGTTDAYQQIHRVNPVQVDFKGPSARQDRLRLLLHRLFENRHQVADQAIDGLIQTHVDQAVRLLDVTPEEAPAKRKTYRDAWPYSPDLVQLLEDQVLVATEAQETRDLIRILAGLFKSRGEKSPVLTAADFSLQEDATEVAALLESVANHQHRTLREKALRNLEAVQQAVPGAAIELPHLAEVLSALWLRSLAVGNSAGAEPRALQLDVTRSSPTDDNRFSAELEQIRENSFNIHLDGNRLVFREQENPQARLLAEARNDRLFQDGSDIKEVARHLRYVLAGSDDTSRDFALVVLGPKWEHDPWSGPGEKSGPDSWNDRIPLVILPQAPDDIGRQLGHWLKTHLQSGRNTVRFLFPSLATGKLYSDRELMVKARAALRAGEWKADNSAYKELHKKYTGEVQSLLKERLQHLAILSTWNFQAPDESQFRVEKLNAQGNKILGAVEDTVRQDLFEPEAFEELVLKLAGQHHSVSKLLSELKEPRPGGEPCIPWLGEVHIKEKLGRLCAAGKISLNLRGTETLQRAPGESSDDAWARMRGRLGSGRHLDDTLIMPPQAEGASRTVTSGGNGPGPTVVPNPDPTASLTGDLPNLFGGEGHARVATRKRHEAPVTSSLNLLGRLESWGVGPATAVREITLRVDAATGAQIQELLKKLPDGMRYGLELQVEGE